MGILDLLSLLHGLGSFRHIVLPVLAADIASCRSIRLIGNTDGIGTKIGDHTHSAASLNVNALIKLLRQTHGLLGGKIQGLGSLLLQGTGGKRQGSILNSFPLLYLGDLELLIFQILKDGIHLCLVMDIHLLVCSVEFGFQRLLLPVYQKFSG